MMALKRLVLSVAMGLFLFTGLSYLGSDARAQRYPPGNYVNSCTDIIKIGHMLEARCQKRDGTWQHTVLYYGSCDGPIHNEDGNLACRQQGNDWIPPGSYQNSCDNIRARDGELSARCQMMDGQWRGSSLYYRDCYQDITNQNGRLTCGRRHHHNMLPGGSYKDTCRDISINGEILSAECQRRDGTWRWTSLNVEDCYGRVENENGRLECR